MSFKHLSGLSVYKVLTVTVALMRTLQYMSKILLFSAKSPAWLNDGGHVVM